MLRLEPSRGKRSYIEGFSARLRDALRRHYGGDFPKAARVARDLNQFCASRADWRPVTAESMRRWMRGVAAPELQRFAAVCLFLGLTFEQVCGLLWGHAKEDGFGATAGNGKGVPANIREALLDLIQRADEEALSAAYLAFLVANGGRASNVAGGGDLD